MVCLWGLCWMRRYGRRRRRSGQSRGKKDAAEFGLIGADGRGRNGSVAEETEAEGKVEFEAHGVDTNQEDNGTDDQSPDTAAAREGACKDETEAGEEHGGKYRIGEREHEGDVERDSCRR